MPANQTIYRKMVLETLAKIERETVRQRLKEYAPGGFQLTVRPGLK